MPHASPDVPGSDVSCPASRAFYEVGDDWRSTPAPEDETESQLLYEYSVREGPENPGYVPTSSSSDIVHQESKEDHVRHLKLCMVNTKNAVESATAGIRSGFQLSADQAMQVLLVSKDMIVQAG
ncbi:hypothetical protein EV401DRAFT_2084003 [Pisolithus croceorrhizus]|nr:hypothetical protein EV401DRAFT_2084003 [Pisolithus croceorrhizus]